MRGLLVFLALCTCLFTVSEAAVAFMSLFPLYAKLVGTQSVTPTASWYRITGDQISNAQNSNFSVTLRYEGAIMGTYSCETGSQSSCTLNITGPFTVATTTGYTLTNATGYIAGYDVDVKNVEGSVIRILPKSDITSTSVTPSQISLADLETANVTSVNVTITLTVTPQFSVDTVVDNLAGTSFTWPANTSEYTLIYAIDGPFYKGVFMLNAFWWGDPNHYISYNNIGKEPKVVFTEALPNDTVVTCDFPENQLLSKQYLTRFITCSVTSSAFLSTGLYFSGVYLGDEASCKISYNQQSCYLDFSVSEAQADNITSTYQFFNYSLMGGDSGFSDIHFDGIPFRFLPSFKIDVSVPSSIMVGQEFNTTITLSSKAGLPVGGVHLKQDGGYLPDCTTDSQGVCVITATLTQIFNMTFSWVADATNDSAVSFGTGQFDVRYTYDVLYLYAKFSAKRVESLSLYLTIPGIAYGFGGSYPPKVSSQIWLSNGNHTQHLGDIVNGTLSYSNSTGIDLDEELWEAGHVNISVVYPGGGATVPNTHVEPLYIKKTAEVDYTLLQQSDGSVQITLDISPINEVNSTDLKISLYFDREQTTKTYWCYVQAGQESCDFSVQKLYGEFAFNVTVTETGLVYGGQVLQVEDEITRQTKVYASYDSESGKVTASVNAPSGNLTAVYDGEEVASCEITSAPAAGYLYGTCDFYVSQAFLIDLAYQKGKSGNVEISLKFDGAESNNATATSFLVNVPAATQAPTPAPTPAPSSAPTSAPTSAPSSAPTSAPSSSGSSTKAPSTNGGSVTTPSASSGTTSKSSSATSSQSSTTSATNAQTTSQTTPEHISGAASLACSIAVVLMVVVSNLL